MNKRGQLSSFMIIGVLFVAAFAFLYFINYLQSGGVEPILFSIGLSSEVNSFKENVDACLEQTTKEGEGLDYFGVKESSQRLIEHYIEAELKDCIDYESFEELGLDIEAGSADARVLITEESVLVDLNYPVTIKKKDAVTRLNNFNYYVEREKERQLSFDSNQKTTQSQTITTEDKDAELTIPAGTKVSDAEGNPINEVSLKILDRNFEGLNNDVVIGMVVYEGLPDGARFEPPVTIKLSYDPNEIPLGMMEEDIKIGWWDNERGLWWGLPSSRVDTVNKIVSAEISHFTTVGKVGCTAMEEITQEPKAFEKEYAEPPIYEQNCGKSYRGEGDCLNPTQWDNVGEIAGWHEHQDTEEEPKLISGPNEEAPLETMFGYLDCSEEPVDWDKDDLIGDASNCKCEGSDCGEVSETCPEACLARVSSEIAIDPKFISGDGIHDNRECRCYADADNDKMNCETWTKATLATYGYRSLLSDQRTASGWAIITFNIGSVDENGNSNGDGCVMERLTELTGTRAGAGFTTEADIDVKVICSPGDACGGKEFSEDQEYTDITTNVPFNPIISFSILPYADLPGDEGLRAGENKAYIKVENMNGDGCVWAEAKISINGVGITFETNFDECTVQDAISTLCGKGSDYNDNYPNCEQDSQGNPIGFLSSDRGPILNQIINSARGVDLDNWRKLSLSQLQDYDDITGEMESLGLTCVQGPWQPPPLSCSVGTMMDSVEACKEAGGRIAPQTVSNEKVCCITEGCCIVGDDCYSVKFATLCINGRFVGGACSEELCGENILDCHQFDDDPDKCGQEEGCKSCPEICIPLIDGLGYCPAVCERESPQSCESAGCHLCDDGVTCVYYPTECEEGAVSNEAEVNCPNNGYLGLSAQVKNGEVDWRVDYACLSDVNLELRAPGYSATQSYGRNMNDPGCGGKQILPEYAGNLKRFPVPECEGTFDVVLYDAGGQCEHRTVTVPLPCK